MPPPSSFEQMQGGLMAWTGAGDWVPGIRSLHSGKASVRLPGMSEEDAWRKVEAVVGKAIEGTLPGAEAELLQEPALFSRGVVRRAEGRIRRVECYTKAGWLDVLTVRVTPCEGGVEVHLKSVSMGLLPMSVPLAPLLNVLFCAAPFFDNFFNAKRCRLVCSGLDA